MALFSPHSQLQLGRWCGPSSRAGGRLLCRHRPNAAAARTARQRCSAQQQQQEQPVGCAKAATACAARRGPLHTLPALSPRPPPLQGAPEPLPWQQRQQQPEQLDTNVWAYKPVWCQPWSIVGTGAAIVGGVWTISGGSHGWTAAAALPVAAWWFLFLGVSEGRSHMRTSRGWLAGSEAESGSRSPLFAGQAGSRLAAPFLHKERGRCAPTEPELLHCCRCTRRSSRSTLRV